MDRERCNEGKDRAREYNQTYLSAFEESILGTISEGEYDYTPYRRSPQRHS